MNYIRAFRKVLSAENVGGKSESRAVRQFDWLHWTVQIAAFLVGIRTWKVAYVLVHLPAHRLNVCV